MKLFRVCCCLVIVFCVVACGDTNSKTEGATTPNATATFSPAAVTTAAKETPVMSSLHVELDIFSGRVNPAWDLTQQETLDFKAKILTLSQTTTGKIWDNLGYRGFVVSAAAGSTTSYKIYNTTIQYTENGKITYYTDPNQEIEKWLLTLSQQHLDSTLYQTLKTQIFK